MDVVVPVFVKDPTRGTSTARRTRKVRFQDERVFLDGPISDRVAILDFDPRSGALRRGAGFVPPRGKQKHGRYAYAPFDGKRNDPRFLATAAFGGVLDTVRKFEEPETLGRRVDWAFDGPQLLVVPRAGEMANAFYERDSRSLQFFYFRPAAGTRSIVYLCKSQDIVAHETAHALIDAVAPDLYDAVSPQSQAIHEGVADLAALFSALRVRDLCDSVLEHTGGDLRKRNAFPSIAEQFGRELDGRRGGLRNLLDRATLTDPAIDRTEPHDLSRVFSAALYSVFVRLFETVRDAKGDIERALGGEAGGPDPAPGGARRGRRRVRHDTPGFALWFAGRCAQRFVLRALDFLPPGEASFADYGRAILAADRSSYPRTEAPRAWLKAEFRRRRIVRAASELDGQLLATAPSVGPAEIEALASSDYAAYRFAERHRNALGVPSMEPFEVRPRLIVRKREWHRDGPKERRQLLFKVSWSEREACTLGGPFPRQRQIHVGTTLVLDADSGVPCACLTTGGAARRAEERADRDGVLARLHAAGALRFDDEIEGIDGRPLPGVVHAQRVGDALRVRGMARMLHMAEVP